MTDSEKLIVFWIRTILTWIVAVLTSLCFFCWRRSGEASYLGLALILGAITAVASFLAYDSYPPVDRKHRFSELVGSTAVIALVTIVMLSVLVPPNKKQMAWSEVACLSNAKQVTTGLLMYVGDNNDNYPPRVGWQSRLAIYGLPRNSDLMICPQARDKFTYGLNESVAGISQHSISETRSRIVIFEGASQTPNYVGGPRDFVPRHQARGSVGLADGHAKFIRQGEIGFFWK